MILKYLKMYPNSFILFTINEILAHKERTAGKTTRLTEHLR